MISFGGNISRHSFIAWLTVKGRLSTYDRVFRCDASVPGGCVMCNGSMDSRDHLFF